MPDGDEYVIVSLENETDITANPEFDKILNDIGSLVTLLYDGTQINNSMFLMILAKDAFMMKLFMRVGGFETEFGACKALLRSYPKVITSKLIKEQFVDLIKKRHLRNKYKNRLTIQD